MNQEQIERLAQAFVNLQRQPAPPQQNAPQPSPLPNFESFSPGDTESGKFSRWYSRFQHFMALHCADWEDGRKISLLMTKLDGQAFEQFESSLLPGKVTDFGDFGEVVAKLRELFDAKRTLFMDRYQALQVQIQDGEDMKTLANRVKRLAVDFDFASFTEENLKTLLFLSALKPKKLAKLRTRLLQTLQTDPNRKLDDLVADCNLYLAVDSLENDGESGKTAGGKKGGKQQQQQQVVAQTVQPTPAVGHTTTVIMNQQQQQQVAAKPKGPPPPTYICANCSCPGHWIWYCPKRAQGPAPDTYICAGCGTKGHHWRWQCPTGGNQRHQQGTSASASATITVQQPTPLVNFGNKSVGKFGKKSRTKANE